MVDDVDDDEDSIDDVDDDDGDMDDEMEDEMGDEMDDEVSVELVKLLCDDEVDGDEVDGVGRVTSNCLVTESRSAKYPRLSGMSALDRPTKAMKRKRGWGRERPWEREEPSKFVRDQLTKWMVYLKQKEKL